MFLNLLLIIFFLIYPGMDGVNWNTFAAEVLIVNLITIPFIGARNKKQFSIIRRTIHSIRDNKVNSSAEIEIPEHLSKLETDIRAMFQRSQSDIAELQKLAKVRKEFLGNVSHELRTPIFAIQGFIETLLDGALEDKKVNRKFLKKAKRHTRSLNNLLNDLIEISLIESGEMVMSFRYFNLIEFFHTVVEEYKPAAEEKNLSLIFKPLSDELEVYGDKNRLLQVMTNLLQNAIKYTEEGQIEISVEDLPENVKVSVSDTGIGIPEKDLSRIFERFYRVDKQRSREVGGTGLGLAIVKHIIEAHGSTVHVTSTPDEGTTFSFNLPKEMKYN